MTFIQPGGATVSVDARTGESVMRAAVWAHVEGIEAECRGSLTCATCHVRVDPAWTARIPPANDDELAMLDFTQAARCERSRLSCQIEMNEELDGLVVEVPPNR